jgi:hypothetical protein
MDGNEDIFGKLMSDTEFRKMAVEHSVCTKSTAHLRGIRTA